MLSLFVAIGCAVLMVGSRLLTNRYCRLRGNEIVAAGTTSGFIPPWISAVYLLGILGLLVTFFWSFFAVAWWAPLVVVALYFLTGFVRSRATDLNLLIRFNKRKKV